MRLLLDTNILLDVLLDRKPWVTDAAAIWRLCDSRRLQGYVSASSFTDIYYIARRLTDTERARTAVNLCLHTFEVCPVDRQTLILAEAMSGSDFEDNVQIACAVLSGLDVIVTRNLSDFQHSVVLPLTTSGLLERLDKISIRYS